MAAAEVANGVKVEVGDLMIMMIDVITVARKEIIEVVVDDMMIMDVVDDRVDTTADTTMRELATIMGMSLVHQFITPVLLHLLKDDNRLE